MIFKEIINLLDNRFGRDIMKCIVKLPFSKKYIDLINIHLIGELFRRFNHNNCTLKDRIEILKILKIYMTDSDTITGRTIDIYNEEPGPDGAIQVGGTRKNLKRKKQKTKSNKKSLKKQKIKKLIKKINQKKN